MKCRQRTILGGALMAFVQGQLTTFPPHLPLDVSFQTGELKSRERKNRSGRGWNDGRRGKKKRDGAATDTWRIDGRRVKVASQHHHRGQRQ